MHDQTGATTTTAIADLPAPDPAYGRGADCAMRRMHLCATLLPDRTVLVNGGSMMEESARAGHARRRDLPPGHGGAGSGAWPRRPGAAALPLRGAADAGRQGDHGRVEPAAQDRGAAHRGLLAAVPVRRAPGRRGTPRRRRCHYGASLTAAVPDARPIASACLMRPGATTHSMDTEQRLVDLPLQVGGPDELILELPAAPTLAPPGWYMLFVLSSDRRAVAGQLAAPDLTRSHPIDCDEDGEPCPRNVHETMFYEVMWRTAARGAPYPMPWWLQSYFRDWPGDDGGMFGFKETALASNALYRYWNMVGVKDAHQESLVGQAGEIEPVYERYAVTFFVVADGELALPAGRRGRRPGARRWHSSARTGYIPVVITTYRPPLGVTVEQRTLSTVVGAQHHAAVLNRLVVRPSGRHAGGSARRRRRPGQAERVRPVRQDRRRPFRRRSCRSCAI